MTLTVDALQESGLGKRGANLSIMIPTYNCAQYLVETLKSLKSQSRSLDDAEIVVLDDCSSKDDPQAAIDATWPDRVRFYRHQKNVGAVANFNACLEQAKRPWVHILHGDDIVYPNAYAEFEECIHLCPDALAVFARSAFISSAGVRHFETPLLGDKERGLLTYTLDRWTINPIQFSGTLISKRVLDEVGGFDPRFGHVNDFNLWWRIASTGIVVYSNAIVGGYRTFEGNHTSSLKRSGKNIQETVDQIALMIATESKASGRPSAEMDVIYSGVFGLGINQLYEFLDDEEAFENTLSIIKKLPPAAQKRQSYLRVHAVRALSRFKRGRAK